jgi:segregation and condensation protein A
MAQQDLPFDSDDRGAEDPSLIVGVDGYEGPLDLLLDLVRRQKVDLHKISVVALADQYLSFIEEAQRLRLELAADYLVMAAWLAYLKSRLMLPRAPNAESEPSAQVLAAALAARLRHLEAIRRVSAALLDRPQLGQDVFARGAPEPVAVRGSANWQADIYDLLSCYAQQRQRQAQAHITIERRFVWTLADARKTLEKLAGEIADWALIDDLLLEHVVHASMSRSVRASTFAAALEMVREGIFEIDQQGAFAPLRLRKRVEPAGRHH